MSLQPKYLAKDELEAKAEELLDEYRGGDHLQVARSLDIEHFAEVYLEANIDYQRLTPDGSVLGMSVFHDLKMPTINSVGVQVDFVFPAHSIVIDYEALSRSPESRTCFTIAHEYAHLLLHQRIYYRNRQMKCSSNRGYHPFASSSEGIYKGTTFNRAEYQANYLGGALLMPRQPFTDTFSKLFAGSWCALSDTQKQDVVSALAEKFETSRKVVAVRIKHLGLVA